MKDKEGDYMKKITKKEYLDRIAEGKGTKRTKNAFWKMGQ